MHDKFYNARVNLDRIAVVLARPSHSGNVGSAARAMKTMGFGDLRLVDPVAIPSPEATALAAGGADVLEGATRHETLRDALHDCVLAVGFTARSRELSHVSRPLREIAQEVLATARAGGVALVFGNETSGLSNDELGHCQRIAVIPASRAYSSLNLASAVQIACYEIATAAGAHSPGPAGGERHEPATIEDLEALYAHFEAAMKESGYLDPKEPGRLMERLRRMLARTGLERSEVKALRGMLEAFEKKMRL
jgi:tRNA/rRNA methyltransferase